jgi:4-amino-4-deoxy-L-arabinose transferase-like glycosyltransferase/Flp pilus assembly protein TadD
MSVNKKKKQAVAAEIKKNGIIFSGKEYKYLSVIFIVGFVLRFFYVTETQNTPFFQNLYSDSKIYYDLAVQISNGNWIGNNIFFMSPGYPYFLAIIFTLFGKSILLVRLIQIFLNSINIIIIYFIARNLHSDKAGFISAAIAALFSTYIFYSGAILLEVIQTFILSILLFLLTDKSKIKNYQNWLLIGILLGVASYFRANILLIFPALVIWFVTRILKSLKDKKIYLKSLIYFSLGCIFPVLLITVRNYFVGNDFVVISSNGGINFYLGNNENSLGIYKTPEDFDFFNDLSGRKYAQTITGKVLSPSDASAFWFDKSINFIEEQPVNWLKLMGKKILFFFDNDANPQSSVMDESFFADNYSFILKFPLPGFFSIFFISIFGFSLTWNKRKEYTLIYIFLLTYIFSTVIFFVIGRFRVAITPLFIVFAGIGLLEIFNVVKEKKYLKLVTPVLIALIFLTAVTYAIPKYNFSDYDAYLNIGNSFFEKHDYDKALINFQKALSLKPDANVYVLIGNSYSAKNDFHEALAYYYKAINKNPDYKLAYYNMGISYVQTRQLELAEKSFLKTISLDSTFEEGYRNLAIIDYIKEDYESSLVNFKKFLSLTKDEKAKQTVLQDIAEIKRRLDSKNQ